MNGRFIDTSGRHTPLNHIDAGDLYPATLAILTLPDSDRRIREVRTHLSAWHVWEIPVIDTKTGDGYDAYIAQEQCLNEDFADHVILGRYPSLYDAAAAFARALVAAESLGHREALQ